MNQVPSGVSIRKIPTNKDNYLKISDFDKICRTCMSKSNLKLLYGKVNLIEMLQFCTMIQFNENDNLPKHICQTCISDLHQAYNFTNKCKALDAALRTCVIDYEKTISNIKTEKDKIDIDEGDLNVEIKSNIDVKNDNTLGNIECVYIVKNEPEDFDGFDKKENLDDFKNEEEYKVENIDTFENVTLNKSYSDELENFEETDIFDSEETKNENSSDPDYEPEESSSTTTAPKHLENSPKATNHLKIQYRCNICAKVFQNFRMLNTHSRVHNGDRPYKCDTCQKTFMEAGHLRVHKRVHTGVKPYQCNVCNKLFSHRSSWKNHTRIHTSERPYKCMECDKSFIEAGHLRVHKRTHTGTKPYECNVCHKFFSHTSTLKSHIRIHTSERPYPCDICPKKFIQSGSLVKHKKIVHGGEKPYQCKVCNKVFSYVTTFRNHTRVHLVASS